MAELVEAPGDNSGFEKTQFEALKAAYRLFGHGDLMKFWMLEDHRCLYK